MFKSQIPVLVCKKRAWDKIANDYSYWREIPEDEYDDWVDLCEELDKLMESCFESDYYIIGNITYWRERAAEMAVSQLSDNRLFCLQKLLKERFHDWRIVLQVWSDSDEGKHLGNILIVNNFFAVTRELSAYFPRTA
jgi:hypothetical protein